MLDFAGPVGGSQNPSGPSGMKFEHQLRLEVSVLIKPVRYLFGGRPELAANKLCNLERFVTFISLNRKRVHHLVDRFNETLDAAFCLKKLSTPESASIRALGALALDRQFGLPSAVRSSLTEAALELKNVLGNVGVINQPRRLQVLDVARHRSPIACASTYYR
jgi:hypothetical protein